MTAAVAAAPLDAPSPWPARLLWLAVAAVTIGFSHLPRGTLDGIWAEVPKRWILPIAGWISAAVDWLINDASFGLFSFRDLTRGLAAALDVPLQAVTALLATGLLRGEGSTAVQLLPPLPWLGVLAAGTLLGLHAGGWRLGLLVGGALGYLAVFGQWQSAMVTLSSIAVAVPFGVAGGLMLGIAAWWRRGVEAVLSPVLDAMQTVPVFAYLLPILILFGFGPVAAMITMLSDSMITWLTPTISGARAAGTITRHTSCRGVQPAIRPNSTTSGATPRSASSVTRTIGGMA